VTHRHDEYWQPVTGGRGPDEPCIEACLREVEEETGVTLTAEQLEVVIPGVKPVVADMLRREDHFFDSDPGQIDGLAQLDARVGDAERELGDVDAQLHWDSNHESFRQVLAHTRP